MHINAMKTTRRAILLASVTSASLLAAQVAHAQPANMAAPAPAPETITMDQVPEQVLVFGRAEQQIGIAQAASEGAISGADLTVRPILRVAELLEAVPGLIAAQHSGSGKANQYFLRGMNLDHGTDFAAFIDDVPWNLRTHGHGQGYLDINGMIPETVARIDYRKGPYRADLGDFSLAGAAVISTVDSFDRPFATIETGSFGWGRLVSGGTFKVGEGNLTLVGQLRTYDGPWQLGEQLRHFAGFAKYSTSTPLGGLEATLTGYNAAWRSTEQIPERAIGHVFSAPGEPTVNCPDQFCVIDPTENGLTNRWIANARLTGQDWRGNVYAQYYNWHMSSNPTYFLEDPVNGDEILQQDRRWTFGGKAEKYYDLTDNLSLRTGVEGRYDDITSVGVARAIANVKVSQTSLHSVQEASAATYAELTYIPIEGLQLLGGVRADAYSFDVKAIDPGSVGGYKNDGILSPKLGIAYRIAPYLEVYGNWGKGFHSNDARGVTTGGQRGLVEGKGKELGTRLQYGDFTFTAAYWWLDNSSELIFVGDTNTVEPKNSSKRHGYELVTFWRPLEWLAIDGVWAQTHSRFDNSPGAEFIPNSPDATGELGISAIFPAYEASMRVRYHGGFPLVEDNSQRQEGHATINLRFAWKPEPWTISFEILNVLDGKGEDMAYWYTSRLPGEPLAGIEGRLSRAEDPRTLRLGAKYEF